MTGGVVRAVSPSTSQGCFYSSVLHILSETGVGMDLIMPWYLQKTWQRNCQTHGIFLSLVLYLIYFWEKMKVSRLSTTENKLFNIKICSQGSPWHFSHKWRTSIFSLEIQNKKKCFHNQRKIKFNHTEIITVNILICVIPVFIPPCVNAHMHAHTH